VTTPLADAELIAAHLAGDPEAFAELFRRHREVLWAVALRTTGDPDEAADALQDAMLSALRAADTFRGRSAVRTWLYRIVVNACLDRLRRSAARPAVSLDRHLDSHDVADPRDAVGRSTHRMDLARALSTLSPGQRAAVVLVDAHGLPLAEVAEILEVPVGTVKSRCARARAHLATELGGPDGTGATGNPGAPSDVPSGDRPRGRR
jgi:RNA polymerase sigma-70 factor (ECF subfamily)